MKVSIFCGGLIGKEVSKDFLDSQDFILCADGGGRACKRLEVIPDYLLGDFDSLGSADKAYFEENQVPIIAYDVAKDDTDGEIAVMKALELGAKEITIFGALGGRMDHTLGNIYLLEKILEKGANGILKGPSDEVMMTRTGLRLTRRNDEYVSLFAVDHKVEGLTLRGFQYPLTKGVLYRGETRGVSNKITAGEGEITLEKGTLLVVRSQEIC